MSNCVGWLDPGLIISRVSGLTKKKDTGFVVIATDFCFSQIKVSYVTNENENENIIAFLSGNFE